MNILFFDTETTGTPKNYRAPITDLDNWPRMIQLGFNISNHEGQLQDSYLSLVQPDGWEVPKEDFWINHNLSTVRCQEEGSPIADVLTAFMDSIEKYDVQLLVAHNMQFDQAIVGSEMIRRELRIDRRISKFCTMKTTADICQIPGKAGYKWPRLEELYQKLFDRSFSGAHDAGVDVTACMECFFELVRLGHIDPLRLVKEVVR